MSSLKEIGALIKGNDSVIIDNQEEGNQKLTSIDNNLKKFLLEMSRRRLDDLEDRRERKKGVGSFMAGGLAKASATRKSTKSGGFPSLKTITAAGLLGALGLGAARVTFRLLIGSIRLALKGLAESVRGLKNQFDDRVKTQRGIARLEADEFKRKAQIEKKRLVEETKARKRIERAQLKEFKQIEARTAREAKRLRAESIRAERDKKFQEARQKMQQADEKFKQAEEVRRSKVAVETERFNRAERIANQNRIIQEAKAAKRLQRTKAIEAANARIALNAAADAGDPRGTNLDADRAPRVLPDGPNVQTTAPRPLATPKANPLDLRLGKISDADLSDAGYRRVIDKTGRVTYKMPRPGGMETFAKKAEVLANVEAMQKTNASASDAKDPRGRNQMPSRFGGAVNFGSAAAGDPLAALQLTAQGVQKGAVSGGGQALAKVAGGAARVLGSMPLLVAEMALMPTMIAMQDHFPTIQKGFRAMVALMQGGAPMDDVFKIQKDILPMLSGRYGPPGSEMAMILDVMHMKKPELIQLAQALKLDAMLGPTMNIDNKTGKISGGRALTGAQLSYMGSASRPQGSFFDTSTGKYTADAFDDRRASAEFAFKQRQSTKAFREAEEFAAVSLYLQPAPETSSSTNIDQSNNRGGDTYNMGGSSGFDNVDPTYLPAGF